MENNGKSDILEMQDGGDASIGAVNAKTKLVEIGDLKIADYYCSIGKGLPIILVNRLEEH